MASPYAENRILEPKKFLTGPGNPESLENVITEPLPDGAACFCIEVGDWFVLDKTSTATVFPPEVIAATSGGRWLQLAALGKLLSFDTVAEFRLHPPLEDLTVFYIKDRGLFVYRATEGAGVADDGLFVLKPASVLLAQPGRAELLPTAGSAANCAAVRTGTNLAKSMTVSGHDIFTWSASANPSADSGNEQTDVIAVSGILTGAFVKTAGYNTLPLAPIGIGAAWITLATVIGPLNNGDMQVISYNVFGRNGSTASLIGRSTLVVQRLAGVTSVLQDSLVSYSPRVQAIVSGSNILIQASQNGAVDWSFGIDWSWKAYA